MLKVNHLHFNYDREILSDVSFQLKEGESLGIVGKSGGGKTTLLKILGGYLTASKGNVTFNGEQLRAANEMLIPGYENIALVHQDFGLNLYHTVQDNIREKVLYLPRKQQDMLIREMIDLLDLNSIINRQAVSLSGGEQQRLSIARALASEADLVLLDEPFVHLDSPLKNRLISYLNALKRIRKTSFVIVTHNGEEILSLCDEVVYLKKGKIRRIAKPEIFYSKPKSLEEANFFGSINSIRINGKQKLFRPDQYSLDESEGEEIKIEFLDNKKHGPIMLNYFKTELKEEILLFSFKSMKNVTCIYV